jgi:ribosome biogenesis GTPase
VLHDLGWDDERAAELPEGMLPARVVAVHRGRVHVAGDGLDEPLPVAGAAAEQPVVGDWVGVRDGAVRAVLPRRTEFSREGGALVANVDVALLASSLNHDLNLHGSSGSSRSRAPAGSRRSCC